jgi:hypothetical protein
MNVLPDSEVLIRRDEVVRIHLDRLQELVEARWPGVPHAVQARQAQGSHSSSRCYPGQILQMRSNPAS